MSASRFSTDMAVASLTAILAVAAGAICLWLLPLPAGAITADAVVFGVLLAFGFFAAERFVVHLSVRRETRTFSLTEIPLVLGLYFAPPIILVLAQVAGATLALRLHRRQGLLKLTFNVANFALGTSVAALLFRIMVPNPVPIDPVGWLAAYLAAFIADLAQGTGVAIAIALTERARLELPRLVEVGTVYTLADASLGIVAALVLWQQPLAAPLLVALAFVTYFGYRAYQNETRKNAAVDELRRSTRAVQRITTMHDVRLALLDGARNVFGADRAELLMLGDSDHSAVRSTLDESGSIQTVGVPAHELARGVWSRVLGEGRGASVSLQNVGAGIREQLDSDGIRNALLAPIHDEERVVGVLQVSNRAAAIGDWTSDDVALFETLANQASVSIANAQLVDRLRESAEEQHRLAVTDSLTGLANRLQFRYWVEEAIAAGRPFGVLLLDIDRFKEINDTLGHDNGDRLIAEIGNRLEAAVADKGALARPGGDEFMILVRDDDPREALESTARSVIAALQRRLELRTLDLSLQGSVGGAVFPSQGSDPDELIRHADVAMYLAKERGTGFELYNANDDPYDELALAVTGDLQRAIEEDGLNVHFQPQLGLASRRFESAEALVRWRHPRRGDIPPDLFVPIADKTGLIRPMTRLVLRKALVECRRWLNRGIDMSVAINLSARNLREDDLPDYVRSVLAQTGVPPSRVTLELTESAIMTDDRLTADVVAGLAACEVDLAIDDFGTGYSSLAYLRTLPAREIKIDRSFVRSMATNSDNAAIVNWTITLSQMLQRRTVAEGVEDAETLELLAKMGCDRAQGYHLGRPMTAEALPEAAIRSRLRRRTVGNAPELAARGL
jgi:diguanylate cyclase (GGDEF)-like protein